MLTLENAINHNLFSIIHRFATGDSIPWYVTPTAYGYEQFDESKPETGSYSYLIVRNGEPTSPYSAYFEAALFEALSKLNEPIERLIRIRIGSLPLMKTPVVNSPHIDMGFPHKTGLLYITESDGDTILYDKRYNPSCGIPPYEYYQNVRHDMNPVQRSSPVANKFILFDGLIFHSSTMPTNKFRRIAVNFNYV